VATNIAVEKEDHDSSLFSIFDYAETYFSPLKQIDSTNVKRLGLAWAWETQAPSYCTAGLERARLHD
jgi:glucose dehydrogenase